MGVRTLQSPTTYAPGPVEKYIMDGFFSSTFTRLHAKWVNVNVTLGWRSDPEFWFCAKARCWFTAVWCDCLLHVCLCFAYRIYAVLVSKM